MNENQKKCYEVWAGNGNILAYVCGIVQNKARLGKQRHQNIIKMEKYDSDYSDCDGILGYARLYDEQACGAV